MITPLEILLDPVSIAVLAMYAILMIWEWVFPARKLPSVKFWKLRGLSAFAFFFFLSSYLPLFIDPYLEPYRLFDLTDLTAAIGGLVGVCLYEFGVYVWHRAMHKSDFLWRTFHQMHHSAERLDTYGAFYFSPMDMIGWTVLGSVCFALLVGLSPQAITVTLLATNFLGMFQHANIKTPTWLGYVIQRPESHTVHHAKGIHKHNYSDLPIFDILFGTFENPKNYQHQTGFFYGASAKVWQMLTFKDLNKERKKVKARGQKALTLLLIASLVIGCSSDQEIAIEPTPEEGGNQEIVEISLDSIRPLSGPKGTLVTFYGKNFGTSVADVEVRINEKEMSVVSVEDHKIQIEVLPSTFSGDIKLTVGDFESNPEVFDYELTAEVTTMAGETKGHTDGMGSQAKFDIPRDLAIDEEGMVYISDYGNSAIRKMTPDGEVTTYTGGGCSFTNGTLETATFCHPYGIFIDSGGGMFVADSANDAIRRIDINGNVFIAMRDYENGNGETERLNFPMDYAIDSQGNSYVVDHANHRILKRNANGEVLAIGGKDFGDVDGKGEEVRFKHPRGLAIDHEDNIFVADAGNSKIRKITSDGTVSTYVGNGSGDVDGPKDIALLAEPRALAFDAQGHLYIVDTTNHKIKKVTPEGVVITLAGSDDGYSDGIGANSQFDYPQGIAVNPEGTLLYVADGSNHRIRKIVLD